MRKHYLRTTVEIERQPELVTPDGHLLVQELANIGLFRSQDKAIWWYEPDLKSRHKIMDLTGARKKYQIFSTAFDGRYVVFSMLRAFTYGDWEMWFWDSHSRSAPQKFAEVELDEFGPVDTPWVYPYAVAGKILWLQATAADTTHTQLFQYDIATGRRRSLRRTQAPIMWGDGQRILLADAGVDGKSATSLRMVDAVSGEDLPLDPVLRSVRGAGYLVFEGDFYAWIQNDDLYAWQTGMKEPVRVLRAKAVVDTGDDSRPLQFLTQAGHLLFFDNNGTAFILDRRSWSYTESDLGGYGVKYPLFWFHGAAAHDRDTRRVTSTGSGYADARQLNALPQCPRGGR